jgi:hypothetical protein
MKRTSKLNSWLFYEPTMLSAVIQRLYALRLEISPELRQATIDLCASAYPDIQPWLVRRQCRRSSGPDESTNVLADLYYSYLSLLLHPMDGHGKARRDKDLVNEWCDISAQRMKTRGASRSSEEKTNFFAVASRASSSHLAYRRDIVHLLQLSMDIHQLDLALDLGTEILDHAQLSNDREAIAEVLKQVRLIAQESIKPKESIRTRSLKRILKLFRNASHNRSFVTREAFNLPKELVYWIRYNSAASGAAVSLVLSSEQRQQHQLDLISFLAEWAEPNDVLQALSCLPELSTGSWDAPAQIGVSSLFPVVQTLLRRAAHESSSSEMSVALLKVKHARMDIEEAYYTVDGSNQGVSSSEENAIFPGPLDGLIWQNMANGMVSIAK